MANFWKGFNQGFAPQVNNVADLLARSVIYNNRQNQSFYNQMELEKQRGINKQAEIRAKLEEEQRKIAETKKYHATNQKAMEGLLTKYDENTYAGLPSEYQTKYNRIVANREEPQVLSYSSDDFIDAGKVEGLQHLTGYQVKRTRKYKGDQLIDLSYGQPFKKEDATRTTKANGMEELSKAEQAIVKQLETNLIQHEIDISQADTYGYVNRKNEAGEKIPYTKDEIKEEFRDSQSGMVETVKNFLGKEKLKPYDRVFNKYRKKDGKVVSPQKLSREEKAGYVTEFVKDVDEAYINKEISAADYKLYDLLLRLDTGLNFKDAKGLIDARQRLLQ